MLYIHVIIEHLYSLLSSMFDAGDTDMNCTQSLLFQSLQSSKRDRKQAITLKLGRNKGRLVTTRHECLTKLGCSGGGEAGRKSYLKEVSQEMCWGRRSAQRQKGEGREPCSRENSMCQVQTRPGPSEKGGWETGRLLSRQQLAVGLD